MQPPFPAHLFHAFLPACRVAGASTKNVRAAADYVKSFIPADVMKRQLENRASSGGASGGAPSRASRSPSQVVHMKVEAGALDDLQDGPAGGTGPGPMASTAPATINVAAPPPDASPGSPGGYDADLATCRVLVKVRSDKGAKALGLGGTAALCEINKNRILSLLPQNATGVSSKHKWPLQLLRRYGQQGKSFYFEAGRRCPSGPVLLYLDMTATDVARLFQTADTALDSYRKESADQKNEELDALRKYKERVQAEEAQKQKEREAAMAKYKREAEAIAKKQIAERARKDAEAQQGIAAEEASKLRTRKQNMSGAGRNAFLAKRNAVDDARQRRGSQLNISERAARAAAPKEGGSSSIGFVEQDEWGVGKSRIWKALNPRPLAYQTAKERAEKEDKIDMGAVGLIRNYATMNNIAHDDQFHMTGEHEVTSPTKVQGRNGNTEVQNHDLDEDEHVRRRRPGPDGCITFPRNSLRLSA